MRFLLIILLATGLAGCAKSSGPLQTYFIGALRFTSGNRTDNVPADTLATRFYAIADTTNTNSITKVRVTVDYSPRRLPFLYPTPISTFLLSSVLPSTEQLVYMDSTLAKQPKELLLTTVFGIRTATGTERWTFTATDNAGNSSARTFIIAQRRADSTSVYNDYTLKLPVPAVGKAARRFIDLKSGLALPAFTVANTAALQLLTDVIVLPDGLTLASPADLPAADFNATKWLLTNRSTTRFYLTTLTPTTFSGVTDAIGLQQQFVAPGVAQITGLLVDQVYAFSVINNGGAPLYGLLRVVAIPAGTTAGLQLEIRIAKPQL